MSEPRAPAFQRLLAWQINSASDALRRGAALRLKREHGIRMVEWRTIALIEAMQPVRLRDVAAESSADKAQISRIVTGLVQRGVVERQAYAGDARSAHLQLTAAGAQLAARLAVMAEDRDRTLRASCGDAAITAMLDTLAAVKARAIELAQEEEQLQGAAAGEPSGELPGEPSRTPPVD